MGDATFSLMLLLGAYANERDYDSLLMRCRLWTAASNVVRQITMNKSYGVYFC